MSIWKLFRIDVESENRSSSTAETKAFAGSRPHWTNGTRARPFHCCVCLYSKPGCAF